MQVFKRKAQTVRLAFFKKRRVASSGRLVEHSPEVTLHFDLLELMPGSSSGERILFNNDHSHVLIR